MFCTKVRPFLNWVLAVACVGFLAINASNVSAVEQGAEFIVEEPPVEVVTYQSYSSLSELVSMICDDAILRFQGFYGPTVVTVNPFSSIGEFQRGKQSRLGITIADQMIAMVNNDTIMLNEEDYAVGPGREIPQRLKGVLQEVEGYLRIHISGVNVFGERLSYVANIEMSEAIYRSLHTYL